jgi:hypothetical protein
MEGGGATGVLDVWGAGGAVPGAELAGGAGRRTGPAGTHFGGPAQHFLNFLSLTPQRLAGKYPRNIALWVSIRRKFV